MMDSCDCMMVQQDDGSIACRGCRGDFYACECPPRHALRCSSHPDQIGNCWNNALVEIAQEITELLIGTDLYSASDVRKWMRGGGVIWENHRIIPVKKLPFWDNGVGIPNYYAAWGKK